MTKRKRKGEFSSLYVTFIHQFQCEHFVVANISIEIKKELLKCELRWQHNIRPKMLSSYRHPRKITEVLFIYMQSSRAVRTSS